MTAFGEVIWKFCIHIFLVLIYRNPKLKILQKWTKKKKKKKEKKKKKIDMCRRNFLYNLVSIAAVVSTTTDHVQTDDSSTALSIHSALAWHNFSQAELKRREENRSHVQIKALLLKVDWGPTFCVYHINTV